MFLSGSPSWKRRSPGRRVTYSMERTSSSRSAFSKCPKTRRLRRTSTRASGMGSGMPRSPSRLRASSSCRKSAGRSGRSMVLWASGEPRCRKTLRTSLATSLRLRPCPPRM